MKKAGIAFFILSTFLAGSLSAWAISEKNYANTYARDVLPYFEKTGSSKVFESFDGVKISYWAPIQFTEQDTALVIIPGRTETYLKYAEWIYDLRNAGFSIYMIDHRGQGLSDRLVENREVGYVRRYADYVSDLEIFIETVVQPRRHSRIVFLAHSMGSTIGSMYMLKNPGVVQAAVLAAPMLELDTGDYSEWSALMLSRAASWAGQGTDYAPGQNGYNPNESFQGNPVTQSRARFDMQRQMLREHPEARLGGVSFEWIRASIDATRWVRNHAGELTTPVLLLQAGKDSLVRSGGQDVFCNATAFCQKSMLGEARHEILMEQDSIRNEAAKLILNFLKP